MFPDTVIAGAVLNGDANVHRPSTPCVVGRGDVAAVLNLIAEKVDWKFAVYGNTPLARFLPYGGALRPVILAAIAR
jgi:hypothetical protein